MTSHKILAVDDEPFNLDILTEYLTDADYTVIGARDGVEALEQLEKHPDIDVIVLDRMMPRMNGMEVLATVKKDPRLREIPVIMQTAAAASAQILEGIQAGVYHYLTKPYQDVMLLSIVKSALQEKDNRTQMKEEVRKHRRVLGLMEQSRFRFRTLDDARSLAFYIANCLPDPEEAAYGLNELLVNAVEHGNLGITYTEKTELMLAAAWSTEVEQRLNLAENRDKYGYLHFEASEEAVRIRIKDQGRGFDWQKYLDFAPDRLTDPHGRGIATTRIVAFASLEYIGCGNEVICTIPLVKHMTD
jgi:CheY-like chemotaxis protein